MIAKVVVNSSVKQTDKLFDYEVPAGSKICVGQRVFVPFGAGNKLVDGFVMYLGEASRYDKLKSIAGIADAVPAFDEKGVKLAEFMRETYFCTYNDAVHVMVPSGTAVKPVEWIVLKENVEKLTPDQSAIVNILREHGGELEVNSLMSHFDKSISAQLSRLRGKGIIESVFKDNPRVSDKTIRAAAMYEDADEELIAECTPKQKRIIDILRSNEFVSVADLIRFSDTSYSVVSALVKKGIIYIFDAEVMRDPLLHKTAAKDIPPVLNDEQAAARDKLAADMDSGQFCEELLFGITGSGKTEVYMRAIEHAVSLGRKAVMLVPEISLTPQTVARFHARFGERICVFHSALSIGERYDEWKRMRDGRADIVIGARSAVFCPMKDIGIFIIDEQHERTYRSEGTPRYVTEEIARFRAKQNNAVLLQASATPSVSSYYRAKTGMCGLLKLTKRAAEAVLPEVEVIDMCGELKDGNRTVLGRQLIREIQRNLEAHEQTVLLLNRRGYSTFVSCRNCGYVAECPNCSISLTYHKFGGGMHCHYCGYTMPAPTVCPVCKSRYIRYFGGGTQKIEEDLKKTFPDASVLRMDVDTTSAKGGHEKLLKRFRDESTDILIGTQMIAKGLDFPNVTLAGVITADTALNMDEYTSSERAFALLEQIAGRAGRGTRRGRAIVQTYTPQHDAIVKMQHHDYEGFYKNEIKVRRAMWYPPFCDMMSVLTSGRDEKEAMRAARRFKQLAAGISAVCGKYRMLGPIPDHISRIKNRYRFRMIIKCDNAVSAGEVIAEALDTCRREYPRVTFVINKE